MAWIKIRLLSAVSLFSPRCASFIQFPSRRLTESIALKKKSKAVQESFESGALDQDDDLFGASESSSAGAGTPSPSTSSAESSATSISRTAERFETQFDYIRKQTEDPKAHTPALRRGALVRLTTLAQTGEQLERSMQLFAKVREAHVVQNDQTSKVFLRKHRHRVCSRRSHV